MVNYTAAFSSSHTSSSPSHSQVQMGVDVGRDPVFLSGTVRHSVAFARAMLALGEVVKLDERHQEKDHSDYQEWVATQYLKELSTELGISAEKIPALLEKRDVAQEEYRSLQSRARELQHRLSAPKGAYYSWLLKNNREQWMVLDPIVSVHPHHTSFEAFSGDESVYARVNLPHDAVDFVEPPQLGTTNIDFSLALEREFARARDYRPLSLTVGLGAVELETSAASVVEKKIDLPESWVRGLVEVQSALALSSEEITLDALRLADVLALLEERRERQGPRSLLFSLVPGEPVTVTIEPWNTEVVLGSTPWSGSEARTVKVWGRRRLRVLARLLSSSNTVTVRLLDSGMPSFWTVVVDGIELTVGLSGWSAQDWASHARFSAFVAPVPIDVADLHQARYLLKSSHSLSVSDLAVTINVDPSSARAILQRLCEEGVAMYEPGSRTFLSRELFPDGPAAIVSKTDREESKGVILAQKATFSQYTDELEGEERTVSSQIAIDGRTERTLVRFDVDGRAIFGECTCSFFRHNKLKKGPCRHMIALVVKSA